MPTSSKAAGAGMGRSDPGWVDTILDWRWTWLLARIALTGPLLIIVGRWVWLGAGMLGIFTGLANLLANRFWAMQGAARFAATNGFFEHIAIIAGFILAALVAEHENRARRLRPLSRQ